MGVYDTFGECQIKAGPCMLKEYVVGERVPLPDGVYVSYDGVVVVVRGVFVAEFPTLTDKWGGEMDVADVLRGINALDAMNLVGEEE